MVLSVVRVLPRSLDDLEITGHALIVWSYAGDSCVGNGGVG